jgi:RNA polymerase sigma-70 factor, ECF subfamily
MSDQCLTIERPTAKRGRIGPGDQHARAGRPDADQGRESWPRILDPETLGGYIDPLYRAAWALCGSRHEAEDLVQETFLNVLKRPRLLRNNNELGYLLRALKNTHASRYRSGLHRPAEQRLTEDDVPVHHDAAIGAREIMEAVASAPALYRDAVIAVDVLGLSYREAARALQTREVTITTRVHRGRRHVAKALSDDTGVSTGAAADAA